MKEELQEPPKINVRPLNHMAHSFFLGREISGVVQIGFGSNGDPLNDLHPVSFQTNDFAGVVREKPDLRDAQVCKDLGSCPVIAEIGWITEALIGLHRVQSLFLKLVGMNLGGQSDAPAFLSHVNKDSVTALRDLREGAVELASTIAAP